MKTRFSQKKNPSLKEKERFVQLVGEEILTVADVYNSLQSLHVNVIRPLG